MKNDKLTTSDFTFDLPEDQIAQTPIMNREQSKLMVLDKTGETIEHRKFYNILEYLNEGDCLVMNNSRVLPARMFGTKTTGAVIEILLLKRQSLDRWECLVKPGKRAKPGTVINFGNKLQGEVLEDLEDGVKLVEFKYEGVFESIIEELGEMPLPPYIKEKLEDQERYQTVYAEVSGSAAAPTAGLHFTEDLMDKVREKGISIAYVTLHVGLGTFRPVKVDNIDEHIMHSEYYELNEYNADIIKAARNKGGRIISVGTTSTRTLESICKKLGKLDKDSGWTDIFIYPGYEFKAVDALITNFHLPESTLLMLVSAFSNREFILKAYKEAVDNDYRFFSFGDAMFIY
ncbi:S-adenosylmethionine--tRNA ribosyltransferase-isomerase [Dethiosulfatibacter aminovorans DSM 17477]|uniref:S-adenosylmethionine:tRNA ribosyltransferase-isomerase n=1 Tax=Dethiosulfatibacter aminovorans DSM 17477 TaxID=1121476 RepID=A0A1M6D3B2_9FIRM|nr:tRNA preQ1(34) S-adenosylmethionine ribosyltransferase-isomerase QueA [Dethiosulfatibacter aminovorans]SHI67611.1 S-adenosylmethionine--tRNA ribosyltransferase-isomerase [Dethiosulfatibacter aminovorans DSM 17477]